MVKLILPKHSKKIINVYIFQFPIYSVHLGFIPHNFSLPVNSYNQFCNLPQTSYNRLFPVDKVVFFSDKQIIW